jgi:hypothetical protein
MQQLLANIYPHPTQHYECWKIVIKKEQPWREEHKEEIPCQEEYEGKNDHDEKNTISGGSIELDIFMVGHAKKQHKSLTHVIDMCHTS